MGTFKGQENGILKEFCSISRCGIVIVPHDLTNKFQPLDLTINKAGKVFIQNQYNDWFSDQIARQLIDLYKHMQEGELIQKGFKEAGIYEAINDAQQIFERVENPFRA